ncbi:hypothetical protein [Candidatus Terasakiella magnetica]|nr:hypothetical protein [Candidatus Terasakiella magnetica]
MSEVMNEKPKLPSKGKIGLILAGVALTFYVGVYLRVYFFGP